DVGFADVWIKDPLQHYNPRACRVDERRRAAVQRAAFQHGAVPRHSTWLASESRRLLIEELMFGSKAAPVPAVPWESIRDNPTDERPGWNFLKDHRTSMPVDGERVI
ncbi:hypothetical protein L13192_12851, partial [Pyrenophora tritici-repentis]